MRHVVTYGLGIDQKTIYTDAWLSSVTQCPAYSIIARV